ncbi:hypothetical protein [Bifidobacterium sp. SO1]|uniref:hypothetical protein n=1 Tax=Bifidobacterium sp. SO1 TaxID=2809029 RepID=UPI001BDC700E|nr:hypothetical protein [Bifidobacterium sp. SO1]MBT1162753.1 hypothetical protein [Bifidobacterium sp. SO1]
MTIPQFETRMRGYDIQQVDDCITQLQGKNQQLVEQYNKLVNDSNQKINGLNQTLKQVSEIRESSEEKLKAADETRHQLEADNKSLKEQIAELQVKMNTASKRSSAWETGQQIVELAEKTKADLIAQATEQANDLRDTSRKQAEELMQNTKDAAAQHLEEAQEKAKRILAEANSQAASIRAAASAYAQKQDEIARKAIGMQDNVREQLKQAISSVEDLVDRKPEHATAGIANPEHPSMYRTPVEQKVKAQPESTSDSKTPDEGSDETQLIPVVKRNN